jgi:hypothetical protein
MAVKRTVGRSAIPRGIEPLLKLAKSIHSKHQADGAASILNNLEDYDWNALDADVELAFKKHKEAEEARKRMEQAYKERDLLMPNIEKAIRATAIMLKGANSKNPKRLGEWGFVINDTPPTKKED